MSDTTTITPEERAEIRRIAVSTGAMPGKASIYKKLAQFLNALEHAEARAEKAEKELAGADAEIAELRDELEDSRGTENDAPHVLCETARLVGVYEHSQELGDDMGVMTLEAVQDLIADKQKAESNAARLTKMVDWLAMNLSGYDNSKKCTVYAADWKEAASRAVAAGEE